MRTAFRQLFRPVTYLRIKHPAKGLFDWSAPRMLTAFTLIAIWLLPQAPNFTGDSGLLAQIQGLIQLLIGFFIAALAAIATFDEKTLDSVMAGTPATLDEPDPYQGRPTETSLTRRRFLCFLFGYLSFCSLVLYLLIMAIRICVPSLTWLADQSSNICVKDYCLQIKYEFVASLPFQVIIAFLFWQMVTITLLGLYYLTDRLHRDRESS